MSNLIASRRTIVAATGMAGVVAALGLVSASASAAPSHHGAAGCQANGSKPVVLRLTDRSAGGHITVEPGDEYRVVSKYGHVKMTTPRTESTSTGTACRISVTRWTSGKVSALYLARGAGNVAYSSGEAHPNQTMDPAMHGRVTIS